MSYPFLGIVVQIGDDVFSEEALVDTGYDGALIIPLRLAGEIQDSPDLDEIAVADGYVHRVQRWDGSIDLAGTVLPVEVVAFGNEFILGREVLDQFEVCFEYGERVVVRQSR